MKYRYCCGEYVFHSSLLYYLVGSKWNFFQSIIFKIIQCINSEFLVQGLKLECAAVFENYEHLY